MATSSSAVPMVTSNGVPCGPAAAAVQGAGTGIDQRHAVQEKGSGQAGEHGELEPPLDGARTPGLPGDECEQGHRDQLQRQESGEQVGGGYQHEHAQGGE